MYRLNFIEALMHPACMLITPACPDGSVAAEVPNPAVTPELLKEILEWKRHGATINDVITRLRQRTVPTGYTIHMWQPSM